VAVSGSGALFATASNDESILVWSTEQVLQSKSQGAVLATLDEHEHQIDAIAWAPLEAARTIEHSEYAGATTAKHPPLDHNQTSTQSPPDPDKKGDDEEEEESQAKEQLSTKDRILLLKSNLKAKREAF
jgi:hypothetical protein